MKESENNVTSILNKTRPVTIFLQIALSAFYIFATFDSFLYVIEDAFDDNYKIEKFYNTMFNSTYPWYMSFATQYSSRLWLIIPIALTIILLTINNNVTSFNLKKNNRFLFLSISIVLIVLVVLLTICACYFCDAWWVFKSL